ncbi:uncharacterized protein AKAW2_31545S [Aspergillus luchuensis]|uniref:Uncharacterized protein n=1 Tax=Aspergillus kawachii TaxID=1069201 RepID=A0A7R7ZYK2_ASPKA|nr:uncharacterized protein AKAW2_31545S [Aspergillus luchuensis]BCR98226.1 hypothetical protein AKAW2_31545S [Aspergillus luchuensis]GAA93331.1 hypothetical protein AKAW_11443 [Aspergillus luchuensis IFO 4308]
MHPLSSGLNWIQSLRRQTRSSSTWGDWDHPDRPTSVEFQIVQHGGHSSAIDLMPCRLQWAKKESANEREELIRAVYEASYLRAENAYYRKVRRAAILFQADIASILLGHDSVRQLRVCLQQIQQATAQQSRRSIWRRRSVFGSPAVSSASLLCTALEDLELALNRLDDNYTRLQGAHAAFAEALRQIDQEYADFFSIKLGNEPAHF